MEHFSFVSLGFLLLYPPWSLTGYGDHMYVQFGDLKTRSTTGKPTAVAWIQLLPPDIILYLIVVLNRSVQLAI